MIKIVVIKTKHKYNRNIQFNKLKSIKMSAATQNNTII